MIDQPHKCLAGCGRVITWQFAICASCEAKYGNVARKWPLWLRYSWANVQKIRRQEKKIRANELSIDSSDLTLDQGETNA